MTIIAILGNANSPDVVDCPGLAADTDADVDLAPSYTTRETLREMTRVRFMIFLDSAPCRRTRVHC